MAKTKIAYVQWPDKLSTVGSQWDAIRRSVDRAGADLLVTNEMPFGPWLAKHSSFEKNDCLRSIEVHERALDALRQLNVNAVISSRPIAYGAQLANEAFVLEDGKYRRIHHKKYFPDESGFFEETWFNGGEPGFEIVQIGAVKVGVLLCTELFFNEHARHYGRLGVDVIVVPRASGKMLDHWKIAGSMAAVVSGAYVISSNRFSKSADEQVFGGAGFAVSPEGIHTGQTTEDSKLAIAVIDLDVSRAQKSQYPCYVKELPID
jgi:N-carbamoylputrescine amidase